MLREVVPVGRQDADPPSQMVVYVHHHHGAQRRIRVKFGIETSDRKAEPARYVSTPVQDCTSHRPHRLQRLVAAGGGFVTGGRTTIIVADTK